MQDGKFWKGRGSSRHDSSVLKLAKCLSKQNKGGVRCLGGWLWLPHVAQPCLGICSRR